MVGVRQRGEQIREFIINKVTEHPADIVALACDMFGISRQAVNKHMRKLVEQGRLTVTGQTKNKRYHLVETGEWSQTYSIHSNLEEGAVWRNDVASFFKNQTDNVIDIWHYGFTELFNNAIDHSSGKNIHIIIIKKPLDTEMVIIDDGEGIFKKIKRVIGLDDERHAVLELAKGKFTTDPKNHTGEGIFFSSRMFDDFSIISGDVHFSHEHEEPRDWIFKNARSREGTVVFLKLDNNSSRRTKDVFDAFTTGDDYGFSKTVVPVHMAQYGDDKLISRSQAKRLLASVDRFKTVILDFEGVEIIGQAFADEIFRVFKNKHQDIELQHINANKEVEQMISRALHVV